MALPLVVIAMSGGVDSSVAAALLKEQGYPLIGIMLHLWSEPGTECENNCCTPDAVLLAKRVASQLGFPFYTIDAAAYFRAQIVQHFLDEYMRGATPNPCMICNQVVRWGFLLERVKALGGEFLATGHYARLALSSAGKYRLLCGEDRRKDQSYVLSMLDQEQLSQTIFPLGEYQKSEVRALAKKFRLPVAERSESQDLCFLANNDYRDFVSRNASQGSHTGPIFNPGGEKLGEHQGLFYYTIGQRKGIGVPSPEPLYVLEKDVERNALIVGNKAQLGCNELVAGQMNWISGSSPGKSFRSQVKIRYKADLAWACVTPHSDGHVRVVFDQTLRDITPGQYAVFYDGDQVIGAGVIQFQSKPGGV